MGNINKSGSMKSVIRRAAQIISSCRSNGLEPETLSAFERVTARLEVLDSERRELRTKEHLRETLAAKTVAARALTYVRATSAVSGPAVVAAFRTAVDFAPDQLRAWSEAEAHGRALEALSRLKQLESPGPAWSGALKAFGASIKRLERFVDTSHTVKADLKTKRGELNATYAEWHMLRLRLRAEVVLYDSIRGTNHTARIFPVQHRRKRVVPAETIGQPLGPPAQPNDLAPSAPKEPSANDTVPGGDAVSSTKK